MATDNKATIKSNYPLPSYQYQVTFLDGTAKPPTLSFSAVSGLTIALATTTYLQSSSTGAGAPEVMLMPALRDTSNPISFSRGVIVGSDAGVTLLYLYQWIGEIQNNLVNKYDITVSLCDESGTPVVMWTIKNAFPIRLDAPSFNAGSNDAAIETLQVLADSIEMSKA